MKKNKRTSTLDTKSTIVTVFLIVAIVLGLYFWTYGTLDDSYESASARTNVNAPQRHGSASNSASDSKPAEQNAKDGYEIPAPLKDRPEQIVRHKGYTLSYNSTHNTPNWSAWALTASHTRGHLDREQKFWADPQIPKTNRVDFYEYKDSEYDRGHMCPAGDMKWDEQAMHDCFYMSNMCPQDHTLNSSTWGNLENACRVWARTEGIVYIVCGPVYKSRKSHRRIGIHHKIDVPEGFFKAVLSLRKGREKAIAFYFDNVPTTKHYRGFCMSVDEIEKMIGMDLFPKVDDGLEKRIEAKCNINDWAQ